MNMFISFEWKIKTQNKKKKQRNIIHTYCNNIIQTQTQKKKTNIKHVDINGSNSCKLKTNEKEQKSNNKI